MNLDSPSINAHVQVEKKRTRLIILFIIHGMIEENLLLYLIPKYLQQFFSNHLNSITEGEKRIAFFYNFQNIILKKFNSR